MFKNQYNKESNILYINRYGEIKLDDLLSNLDYIHDNFDFITKLYVLEDARESNSVFNTEDYPLLIKKTQKLLLKHKSITLALIVDTPSNTALSLLFEMIADQLPNYSLATYCTVEAAEDWLQVRMKMDNNQNT